MATQRGSVLVIVVILLLLIVGGAVVYYFYTPHLPSQSTTSVAQTVPSDPIKNHISFTKPASWNEQTAAEGNNLIFKSSDLTVMVNRLGTDPAEALDQSLHPSGEQAQYNSDITKITVSGLQAVSYHNNYEEHDKTLVIAQPPVTTWEIHISSKDLQTENLYKTEIDQFIQSIIIK